MINSIDQESEMKSADMKTLGCFACILLLAASSARLAAGETSRALESPPGATTDWPQFRGPERSGVSLQEGLMRSWPEEGPKVVWRRPVGEGFSGVVVSEGDLYTLFAHGEDAFVARFNAADGQEVWRTRIGEAFKDEFGKGPRSIPTVDGDAVYALGARGNLVAVRAETGEEIWTVDLMKAYGFHGPQMGATGPTERGLQLPNWGYSFSPLVEGDLVYVPTGHGDGESYVAFDKTSGETRWTALDDGLGYSSPIGVTIHGQRQVVALTPEGIVSLLPTGEVYWRWSDWPETIGQPVFVAPDMIFASSALNDTGSIVLRVGAQDGKATVEPLWRSRIIKSHWNSAVAYEGYVYGFDNATLRCVEAATGELAWAKRGLGKGNVIIADGLLLVWSDQGKLTLADADPQAFHYRGQVQVFDASRTWSPPAIADGKLYLRGAQEMVCLDLKG